MATPTTTVISNPIPVPTDLSGSDVKGISTRRNLPAPLLAVIVFVMLNLGQALIWLACRLNWRNSLRLLRWVSRRVEPLTRRRRSSNFHIFFRSSERTQAELQRIDRAHLEYLARMRTEIARAFSSTPAELERRILLDGETYLRDMLAQRRGALLVSGHTATWWFMPAMLAARGYPVTAVFTPIKFPRVERKLLELTNRYNVRIAFVGRDAYRAALRAIERNELLYLTFDVPVRTQRAELFPFGNGWLPVDPGPAIMAVRNAMPTLQAGCAHLEDGRTRVSIYNPTPAETAPQNATAKELCALWTHRLEKELHRYPEQWWPWGYSDVLDDQSAAQQQHAGKRRPSARLAQPAT